MALTEDIVLEELKKVIDPELFVNIVDLGLIYNVAFEPATGEADGETGDSDAPIAEDAQGGEAAASETEAATAESHASESAVAETTGDSQPEEAQAADAGSLNVKIDMTMTSPMCPAGPQLIGQSKTVVGQLPDVANVEVKIVLDPPWTPDRMTDDARDKLGIF